MHVPKHYEVIERSTLEEFIRSYPFGLLITHGEGGLLAEHLPFIFAADGELIGHMNAKNPAAERLGGEGLAVFSGPHAYISPRWYPSGFNVPTWNYQAVHVSGQLRRLSPDENYLSLKRLVGTYENLNEPPFQGMFEETSVEKLSQGTTGFGLTIEKIYGQFKLSQNKTEQDKRGAIEGLRSTGNPEDAAVAAAMESVWSS